MNIREQHQNRILLLIWKHEILAWWLAGKENMDVTAVTNSINSLLLPEEVPLGYKPFGLPESALTVKTRAVCIHEFASALVFIEGAWLCAKGLAQFGLKHIAESKTTHVFLF